MPKVCLFAPSGNMAPQLRDAGCDTVLGLGHWHAPSGNYYGEMIPMAEGAGALHPSWGTTMDTTLFVRCPQAWGKEGMLIRTRSGK